MSSNPDTDDSSTDIEQLAEALANASEQAILPILREYFEQRPEPEPEPDPEPDLPPEGSGGLTESEVREIVQEMLSEIDRGPVGVSEEQVREIVRGMIGEADQGGVGVSEEQVHEIVTGYIGTLGEGQYSPRRVGPLRQGDYHTNSVGSGIVFHAEEGTELESCVVDVDTSAASHSTLGIALAEYRDGYDHSTDPQFVDTMQVEVVDGPQRIEFDLGTIPEDGTYLLAHDTHAVSTPDDSPALRRIGSDSWGDSGWESMTYDAIDFFKGSALYDDGDFGAEEYYYYFFDIGLNSELRIPAPWSTDVEEIYRRPTDPEEEQDVGSRAIWFDTSE